jgi:hypothetical protein
MTFGRLRFTVSGLVVGAALFGSAFAEEPAAGDHWAYRKPLRPALPAVKKVDWPRNGLDSFVLARLEAEGLRPSPEADRATLIRRLSLDLIGLPPSVAEVGAFVSDPRPDAYERLVERLLASPRYGERWARPWLDAARYADTNGYEKDRPRTMWLWRDWVIGALNADMPFDEFTLEQLAGDLLPDATADQKVATGFHRNTMLNDEGGIDAEEFRVVAVKDRVDATATVWLGTTLDCAQCHTHKYDPFTQKEYYQFYAFFNHTADSGVGNGPEMPVPTADDQRRTDRLRAEIAALDRVRQDRGYQLARAQAEWEENRSADARGEAPAPAGASLHYPLNGGEQRRVPDASGQGRHGTFVGGQGPAWSAIALALDGSGSHVDGGNVADFERTDYFSYGCWVKPQARSGCVLSKMDDPQAYRGFDLFLNDGRFEAHLVHAWPDNGLKVTTKRSFPAGTWYHALVTYDGSSRADGVRLYVDGKEEPLAIEKDALVGSIRTGVSFKVGRRHVAGPLKGAVSDVRVYDRTLTAAEVAALAARHPALAIAAVPRAQRTPRQTSELAAYYRSIDPELVKTRRQIAERREALAAIKPATAMVMVELPKPRENYIMLRGNFNQKGKPVEPGTPKILHPFPDDAPRNRLGLARWLVDRENPLTARVTVNRHWQAFFGRGLVQTPEDFGTQGDKPTHPELLDWLAIEFMDRGWSMKALHRLIATSATYRQASRAPAELVRRDPYNLFYARGPRLRVEYETLRDLALAAGGLLSQKIGGPSVMPPQPLGIWENSFGFYDLPDFRWKEATGENRYRRGIYTFLRRTALYPTFVMFDAPDRTICSVKRPRTNTPLQALATLNDPVFVEAAAGLARRVLAEAPGGVEGKVRFAFRICVARQPDNAEVERLVGLYRKARSHYENEPASAAALLKAARVAGREHDGNELAAWVAVANALLNLDETVSKG